ncbi:hypothetical protein [Paenarthrobacter nitroguajacolicus]|uniref:hypothetical protein n=1 Tax=Paenarthrobacter nitroguajacolicus TaxID=211146 RepID=UPI0015C1BE60|nr:hypothetical protein [Paenarthrobacter nitroguajacolicus]NWL32032.1 hypothetical protein [Paenarthrobacter nitroguajacolicus]
MSHTPGTTSIRSTFVTAARQASKGVGLTIGVGVLSAFSFEYLATADPPALDAPITASTENPLPTAVATLVLTLIIVVLLLAGGCGKTFGLHLPQRRRPWTVFLACTLLSFSTILVSVTVVDDLIEKLLGRGQPSNIAASWAEQPVWTRFLQSADAGIFEEVIFLALPFGFVLLGASFARSSDRPFISRTFSSRNALWMATALATAFIIVRVAMHTYQGWAGALTVAVWATGQLLIFRYGLSVWPLVLAHFTYDFFVAGGTLWPQSETFTNLAVILGFLTGTTLLLLARQKPATESHHPSVPSTAGAVARQQGHSGVD